MKKTIAISALGSFVASVSLTAIVEMLSYAYNWHVAVTCIILVGTALLITAAAGFILFSANEESVD